MCTGNMVVSSEMRVFGLLHVKASASSLFSPLVRAERYILFICEKDYIAYNPFSVLNTHTPLPPPTHPPTRSNLRPVAKGPNSEPCGLPSACEN